MSVDPTALMIGTDLPSTRARRPFQDEDFEFIAQVLDPAHVADVFWNNAAAFYLGRYAFRSAGEESDFANRREREWRGDRHERPY